MRYLAPFLAALLGCSDPTDPAAGGGGKADDPEVQAELRCVVAHVLDEGPLGEGLHAAFDIDRQGVFRGDPAATLVHVGDGTASLGLHDFDDVEPTADGYRVDRYRLRLHGGGTGTLALGDRTFATLDCRDGAAAPNHDDDAPVASCAGTYWEDGYCRMQTGHFAAAACCQASCDVVTVDEPALGDALAARFAADPPAGDATSASLDQPRGAWRVGRLVFSADGGDDLERRAGLESYFQFFRIRAADGLDLEVRIFDTSRLGVVLLRDAASPDGRVLARLDCRARR